jgi:hypothetical protein
LLLSWFKQGGALQRQVRAVGDRGRVLVRVLVFEVLSEEVGRVERRYCSVIVPEAAFDFVVLSVAEDALQLLLEGLVVAHLEFQNALVFDVAFHPQFLQLVFKVEFDLAEGLVVHG